MESKGGKKKSSSSSSKSLFYEAPLGYSIEDIRPNGGIKKFRSAAYSNVSIHFLFIVIIFLLDEFSSISLVEFFLSNLLTVFVYCCAVRSQAILIPPWIDSSLHASSVSVAFFFVLFSFTFSLLSFKFHLSNCSLCDTLCRLLLRSFLS